MKSLSRVTKTNPRTLQKASWNSSSFRWLSKSYTDNSLKYFLTCLLSLDEFHDWLGKILIKIENRFLTQIHRFLTRHERT